MSLIRLRSRERARIKPALIRNRVYGFYRRHNDTGLEDFFQVQVSFVSMLAHSPPAYNLDWGLKEKNRNPRGITAE